MAQGLTYAIARRLVWALLLMATSLNAQWQEVKFDDSDMALDLTEALSYQKYPTYDQYVKMMQGFAEQYPQICRLDTFGTSIEGRLLLALEISDHPGKDEAEASFLYTSTMHGDELLGFVLLLRLADFLLGAYGSDSEVKRLVDNLSIWINPMANPDGSYSADGNASLTHSTRYNTDGIDLNRNFPAPGLGETDDTTGRALENRHMMSFLQKHLFSMSANLHGGAEVVNYPWDHTLNMHADDAWYRFVSREYADEAMAVDPGYMFGWPDNGITNGAAWYVVPDGRQDYVNYYLEGREVTLELSNEKRLGSDYLEEFWNKNKRSLINYMSQCLYGIRGVVSDGESGKALRARIHIPGHDDSHSEVNSSSTHGDFYRLIKEGTYDLVVSAPGYINDTLWAVEVTDYQATQLDIQLSADEKTGLSREVDLPEFSIYPNPARERIYVAAHGSVPGPLEIRLWSVDGNLRIHQQRSHTEFPLSLSLENLPKGYYILNISTPGLNRSMGFVKQ